MMNQLKLLTPGDILGFIYNLAIALDLPLILIFVPSEEPLIAY